MATSVPVHALISRRPCATVEVDPAGPFAVMRARREDGRLVALNSRRDPVEDADRWLTSVLRDDDPPVIVLIGLGLGYVLDALERRGSRASVIAFEPFADALWYFQARRDWSAWIDSGRLHIVTGPKYDGAAEAWCALEPPDLTPVLVTPAFSAHFSALVAQSRVAWMRSKMGTRLDPRLAGVKQSMLDALVLTTLEHFAANAHGAIVEIGAYVGGGTIAMARGVRDSGRNTPIITIEPGGAHRGHPDLPSVNIFGDLQRNLRDRKLDGFVTLHKGWSHDRAALDLVTSAVASTNAGIDVLCIDADGEVQRDFDLYLPLCADGCLLVVDDYVATAWNPTKWDPTQAAVRTLVAAGRAYELGVYGFGTWVGVYRPKGTPSSALPEVRDPCDCEPTREWAGSRPVNVATNGDGVPT